MTLQHANTAENDDSDAWAERAEYWQKRLNPVPQYKARKRRIIHKPLVLSGQFTFKRAPYTDYFSKIKERLNVKNKTIADLLKEGVFYKYVRQRTQHNDRKWILYKQICY